jgi:paraquat-inducible protein B
VKISDGMARIPVYAELSQARTYTRQSTAVTHDLVAKIVEDGLKARLDTESFLTGVLYVDLDFQPGEPAVLIGGGPEGYVEIPTLPTRVGEVIRKVTAALAEVDIKEMIESITSAAKGVDELARSPRIDQGFTSVDQTLTRYRELAQTLDANVKTLTKELESTLSAAREALAQTKNTMKNGEATFTEVNDLARDLRQQGHDLVGAVQRASQSVQDIQEGVTGTLKSVEVVLDPDAPLVLQLRDTLWQLGRASHSLALFADELQRNPSLLLRGRDVEGK